MKKSAKPTNEVAHHRLLHQQIHHARGESVGDIVASLGAMQAQDYPGALWAIGLRRPGVTEAAVEKAIAERQIVRTWPMRGTLHFVAPADIRWLLKLLTPRIVAGAAERRKRLELDDATFAKCEKAFVKALQGGKQLTRDEMQQVAERAGVRVDAQRSYHIFWRLAQEGVLCFAARQGKQQTFALLEEWVPKARPLEREAALAELARRYFTSHGPAQLRDFVWWSGLRVIEARTALELASAKLAKVTLEGETYWRSPEQHTAPHPPATAYLLPGFDEYLLGYKDRSAVLDKAHAEKIVPGSNGMFLASVVLHGRVAGTWKKTPKKNVTVITVNPFAGLKKAEKEAIAVAAEQYGRFMNQPVETAFA